MQPGSLFIQRGDYVPDLITKYVDVTFNGTAKQMVEGVFQYDHGLYLRVRGVPTNVEWQFQFGCRGGTESLTTLGEVEGDAVVGMIPDTLLMQPREVVCYLYYEDEEYGITIYEIIIPLTQRVKPADGTYTPEQIDAFDTLVATLQGLIEAMPEVATVAETKAYLGIT